VVPKTKIKYNKISEIYVQQFGIDRVMVYSYSQRLVILLFNLDTGVERYLYGKSNL
jgi:hypothetical protein